MSRSLGLGVDSLIEIRIVTPDGNLRSVKEKSVDIIHPDGSVTPDENSDLWWSLRGGGYGLGVVTAYRMKMHDPPAGFTQIGMVYPIGHPLFGFIGDQVLDHYSSELLGWPDSWGGYLLVNNYPFTVDIPGIGDMTVNGTITYTMLHYGPYEEAWPAIQPLYDFRPEWTLGRYVVNYTTFWEYQESVVDEFSGRGYIANKF